ncbi:MAG: VOC family protein [Propionibacteriaceae bacterium]|jgi:PhnB protein|nr:VOC family protein [Propionibacteriaceae bacterium]
MSLDPYLFFDGDCRAALAFYAAVFQTEPSGVMAYAQAPGFDPADPSADRVLYASLPIGGVTAMLSDVPVGQPYVSGNHVALSFGTPDPAEAERVFAALADGGHVHMPLAPTFFNPLYGMLTDRFGVMWMVSQTPPG